MTFPTVLADVAASGLSDDEQATATGLSLRLLAARSYLEIRNGYYEGTQQIRHLGIAVPEQLQSLHSVIGWPRLAVDVLDERLDVQGFRMPDSTDADEDLWNIWTYNQMDQESQLAHLDALVFGRAFVMLGSPVSGDIPLITVESPLNMMADFDATTRRVKSALQYYEFDGEDAAALYLPGQTVHLIRPQDGPWQIRDRDEHGLDWAPVVMLANRQRSHDRYGLSEITPEVMSLNDAACRTVLGMEIAREFFAAQQRYILGATESAFVNPDGSPTDAWKTYIGWYLALERDEEGNVPQVGTFPAQDPTPFTAVLQDLSRRFSATTGLPPHLLGFASDNPASAEGIRSAEARLDKRAERKQRAFEGAWRDVMRLALQISGGPLPDDSHKLDVLWADASTPTPAATTQAILQQVQMGFLPPESDVTGERLGYSAVERARIASDRKRAQGSAALQAIIQRGVSGGQPAGTPASQGGAESGAAGGTAPPAGTAGPGAAG